ncbi:YfjI family protein [Serratia fonticola]|uniref:YfjI family protein n=1 Tax=Serratia fonticola TaxID=47917 RepID=UPI0003FD3D6C|nr:YfjI family protein [Serratia fonticola]
MHHMPKASTFPQENLPPKLNEVTQAITGVTQAPVELIVNTCLSAMSLASQALVVFQHSDGRTSPVSLYNVVIAESGERKTAVYNQVMKPILEFEKQAFKTYSEQIKVYEADSQTWNAINKTIIKKIKKNEEKGIDNTSAKDKLREHYAVQPVPPRLPKLLYNDATYEAIVKGLSENIGSAGLVSDEGGGILNGRAMNNSPLFNQLWDGGSFDIERKNHRLVIDNSRFSILILTQHSEFKSFIKKRGERALGNGFFARCLWSVTTSTQGQRTLTSEIKNDDTSLEQFHKRITELLVLTAKNTKPKVLRFSSEAETRFSEFNDFIEKQITIDINKHDSLPGILSKIPENIIRLTSLIHFFYGFEGEEISVKTLNNVILIVQYYYNQVVDLLTLGMEKVEKDADVLHKWLLNLPSNSNSTYTAIARTYVRRYGPYQLRDSIRFTKALKILEDCGRISINRQKNTNGSTAQLIQIHRN